MLKEKNVECWETDATRPWSVIVESETKDQKWPPNFRWEGSAASHESTLHQLSPYIGKMKSSMAQAIVRTYTRSGETVYDPFCGSGTVAFEAWAAGRNVIANDLSKYAATITRAKLSPPESAVEAMLELEAAAQRAVTLTSFVDLRKAPKWVRSFFHPETLREILAWSQVLRQRKSDFMMACLLGILHHQRPGFLSYPSSHSVPYLRLKKFPRDQFPELYQYRSVRERLQRKVERSLKRIPPLDGSLLRECHAKNAAGFRPEQRVNAVITSPPYMSQLDYGRDNRLRLWLLGAQEWRGLDRLVSPKEDAFLDLMKTCLKVWLDILTPRGVCVLVLGDTPCRSRNMSLPDAIVHMATEEVGGFRLLWTHTDPIPDDRRVRRGCRGNLNETIVVLGRKKGE